MDNSRTISMGRGRGRARNLASLLNRGENGQQKYAPINIGNDEQSQKLAVEESLRVCLTKTTQENIRSCLSKAEEYAKTESLIKNVVCSLFEKCLERRNWAANGGQVAAVLISSEKMGTTFRSIFLKQFQETYTNRETQRKTEFGKYLCFSIFLCSIFKDVRVNNGQVMKILTKPVCNMLNELLNSEEVSQREKGIEVFRDNLLVVASLLQETDKGQMDELFKKVRNNIVKETSPKISCILLETFEYYSTGDWTVKDETKDFYKDLMDDITGKS